MRWTTNVTRRILSNGLTLLVERDTSAPVVAAVTHVRAGYFDEPDRWVGIAHVLEHMFFKGTPARPPGQVAREIQLLGGYLNAGTIYDKTVYYTVLPAMAGTLERAVDLQADALMHAALDPSELTRELEVIIQEAKRKLDNPHAVAQETLYELLFAQHRMRRWRIGTEAGLRQLTDDDVREYYQSRYTPDRTIVALVGDLDVDRALEHATAVLGAWDAGPARLDRSPPETDPPPPALRVLRGDVERPLSVLGWRTVDALHPDVHALDIAAALLGAGRGSWLTRAIRIPGLASGARASHYTPTEVGVFDLLLEGDPRTLDDAVRRALELVARLGDTGPGDGDVERVRALQMTQWARQLEIMDTRAALFCEFESLGGYQLADECYRKTLAVTADDVQRVARRYLLPETAAAVLYLAPDMRSGYDGARWPPSINGKPLVGITPPRPGGRPAAVRAAGHRASRHPGEIHHLAMAGADVLVRSKHGSGLVFVGALAQGLREEETEETAGVSALLTRAALRGAGGMTAEQLALAAETVGGRISPVVTLNAVGWGLTVRSDALAQAARLLLALGATSTLAAEELAVERALQASDAARAHDDMFRYPIRRVLGEAFPRLCYGLPTLGEPDRVPGLSDELVRNWADRLRRRRLVVVAVGELEPEAMLDGLAPFEDWPATAPARAVDTPLVGAPGRGEETRRKAQSAVAMAFPSGPYGSPHRFPLIVSSALLSGLAGRLFQVLRDERSLAYTVAALPWLQRRAGVMLTYIATSPEREAEARQGMLDELSRLSVDAIDDVELDRARNYAAGAVQLRLQSAHAVATDILDAWTFDELDALVEEADRLRAVTREDVRAVAADVFRPEHRAEFVVHGTGGSR